MSITIGGTFSGLNVTSIINSIIAADSIPITNLQTTDTNLQTQSTDLGQIGSSLGTLSQSLQALGNPSLFSTQTATSSTPAVGSAAVDATAVSGSTDINIQQIATTTVLTGSSNTRLTGAPATTASIDSVLNETSVQGQTFSINGAQISLADTDTLGDVLNKINSSGAGVTATYDNTTGNVTIASNSSSPVILGSGSDTSDFLKQAELFNNGGTSVTSAVGLGRINSASDLSTAGLGTTPTTGTFSVNGVSIDYDSGDTLQTIISKINNSGAGVSAVYDQYDDRMVLSATSRGPQSITVADGTSNMATALGLTTANSSLSVGKPTLYTVNGSSTVRQADSNVLDGTDLGVQGLTFTATGTGDTTVSITPDVTTIAAAINQFIGDYNSAQGTIGNLMMINTSDTTQDGALATDTNLTFLAPQLRTVTASSVSSTAVIRMLSDLGVTTNANDNTMTQADPTKLQDALTNHLSDVEALFNGPNGLVNSVQSVISTYNDSLNGVIVTEQNNIKNQISYNQSQITRMQENITTEQTQLENEFAQLDEVEAKLANVSSIFNGNTNSSGTTSTSSSSTTSSGVGTVGGLSSSSSS